MLLRLSMPLILASSVTFVIGFMLIPWVLGMLTVFYLAGIVSNLSVLGRAILFPSSLFGPMVVKATEASSKYSMVLQTNYCLNFQRIRRSLLGMQAVLYWLSVDSWVPAILTVLRATQYEVWTSNLLCLTCKLVVSFICLLTWYNIFHKFYTPN
ncbi:unnamed protein product [Musa acuminata subsp. malaccensis]|uniref:(wild Malaysian banana) hypothetical protein n=1 Tax=Musa acuminata subsp. malaccensis TaxID=214687 RepID=A0A804JLR8_MUSAM|nr:PREDICTED: uncharacterized protein LOC103989818 isoform X1 [Musa acuminata subsp. malaccensis]CAG1847748.1 unnamed protein product [Musa acuminata subsp. malaccensis]